MAGAKKQPLSKTHPDLSKQWDGRRNENLTPNDVFSDSKEKVWWNCPEFRSHIWAIPVCERATESDRGCPFCWAKKQGGKKSLQDLNQRAAELWHPTRNKSLTPSDVLPNSSVVAWWQCPKVKSHIWQAEIYQIHRAVREDAPSLGCPKCKPTRRWEKWEMSLEEAFPKLAEEWHVKKNKGKTAAETTPGSSKSVWWRCPVNEKHDYQMKIYNRVYLRTGCPYCANMRILPDINSLAVTNSKLASQWHPEKNREKPDQVVAGSTTRVWWQCPEEGEHVWEAQVFSRTVLGTGCPFCTGRKVDNTNCLATVNPELAKEWHPVLNMESGLTPYNVSRGSDKRVWWQCKKDSAHYWQAQVSKRSEGRGLCPDCNPRSRARSLKSQVANSTP